MTEVSSAENIIRPGVQRGLDFVRLQPLQKRTGVAPSGVVPFALSELIFNALDKQDATEIKSSIQGRNTNVILSVSDNGFPKIEETGLKRILDFDSEASSKRDLLRVSRGNLGNALKCVYGYSYVLTKGVSVLESGTSRFLTQLKPDYQTGKINHELKIESRADDGFTTFSFEFPGNEHVSLNPLLDTILATSYVNPDRKFSYDFHFAGLDGSGAIEPIVTEGKRRGKRKQETCALWYTESQFEALVEDYCNAKPDLRLESFLTMFRGFSSRSIQREVCDELRKNCKKYHDFQDAGRMQFLQLSDVDGKALFSKLRQMSKQIERRSIPGYLGCVGKEVFEKMKERNGWRHLRYRIESEIPCECPNSLQGIHLDDECASPDHREYPFLLEVAIFDRAEDDDEGTKIYSCVNFAATEADVFSQVFDIPAHLAKAGIRNDPVTVIAHYVCPVLKWLNYGKTAITSGD